MHTSNLTTRVIDEYVIEDVPDFVVPVGVPNTVRADVGDDCFFYLVDTQIRASNSALEVFSHFIERIDNHDQLSKASVIEIQFDPRYQTIALHEITIKRENETIYKLNNCQFKVIQREENLDNRIYHGKKTLVVFVDDVQLGDVLESKYTISGFDDSVTDFFFKSLSLSWGVAVAKVYYSLTWQRNDTPIFQFRGGPQIQPMIISNKYIWDLQATKPCSLEEKVPPWFFGNHCLFILSDSSWEKVSSWLEGYFKLGYTISEKLQNKIQFISDNYPSSAKKLLYVTRYIQTNIRYLGLNLLHCGFAPNEPNVVFERMYGDCKDKSLLMAIVLTKLGIKARVALVNSELQHETGTLGPSPFVFNHCIVKVDCDGVTYWIDPTLTCQGGDLQNMYQFPYGYALVLNDGTRDLEQVITSKSCINQIEAHYDFTMTNSSSVSTSVRIESFFRQNIADQKRFELMSISRKQTQEYMQNFYSKYFPKIYANDVFTVNDNLEQNELCLIENYTIPDFFQKDESHDCLMANIIPFDFIGRLRWPQITKRQLPYLTERDLKIRIEFVLNLFIPIPIQCEAMTVKNKFFTYVFSPRSEGNVIRLSYLFETKEHVVPPAEFNEYLAELEKIESTMSMRITCSSNLFRQYIARIYLRLYPYYHFALSLLCLISMCALIYYWISSTDKKHAGFMIGCLTMLSFLAYRSFRCFLRKFP
ncbi:MAG: DUF3857 domain-containing protein [Bdellovibrio sp.]|nr:DUF3857 domain-containing protein [Bdellovibrio sp.]